MLSHIKVSFLAAVCSTVLANQAIAAPTLQMYEEVFAKQASDSPLIAGYLQESYDANSYDRVEAWMTYFTIFPEGVDTTGAIDAILIDWATNRPNIPSSVIEKALMAKTLARSPLPALAAAKAARPVGDIVTWGNWRRQNPTKGYLSPKFKAETTLPVSEASLFNAMAFLGDKNLEPTEAWLKSEITKFGTAASGLKGTDFGWSLTETLYHGGVLTTILTSPDYLPNNKTIWPEAVWGIEVPKFAKAVFTAKNDLSSVALQPIQSNTLANMETTLNGLSGTGANVLAPYRASTYSRQVPLYFAYVWPTEGQASLLHLLSSFATANTTAPQTTNALNFVANSADYFSKNKAHPNRYLSSILLAQSDINADSFQTRPEGSYAASISKPAWLTHVQNLSTTFSLNYHEGYNCQEFKGNGFDSTFKNTRFQDQFLRAVPAEYLPANGDLVSSGKHHRRFSRCEPLVQYYKHSMGILLADMKKAKDSLIAAGSNCYTKWQGHYSSASDACPLYINAGMVANESQASALYNDQTLKQNWFHFLSNNPAGDLRNTQLEIWSRDPEGIQEQFTCSLWRKHNDSSRAATSDDFAKKSFEDTTGFLFTLAMAHKDLTAAGVVTEDFAQYTSDVNKAEDACSFDGSGDYGTYMPTDLYSQAYSVATGLAHIVPLQ